MAFAAWWRLLCVSLLADGALTPLSRSRRNMCWASNIDFATTLSPPPTQSLAQISSPVAKNCRSQNVHFGNCCNVWKVGAQIILEMQRVIFGLRTLRWKALDGNILSFGVPQLYEYSLFQRHCKIDWYSSERWLLPFEHHESWNYWLRMESLAQALIQSLLILCLTLVSSGTSWWCYSLHGRCDWLSVEKRAKQQTIRPRLLSHLKKWFGSRGF